MDSGGRVATGGRAVGDRGWFYAPDRADRRTADGAGLRRGDLRPGRARSRPSPPTTRRSLLANDTEYGLVAYAFTQNLSRALAVAEGLDTGMVGINQGIVSNPAAPFGGVKASGFGREGGAEGIEEYLETKYVGIKP